MFFNNISFLYFIGFIMKGIFLITLSFIIFSVFPNTAYAYIDPGTGGIIIQFLIAIIAGIASFWLIIKQKIKSFFKKNENKKDENK